MLPWSDACSLHPWGKFPSWCQSLRLNLHWKIPDMFWINHSMFALWIHRCIFYIDLSFATNGSLFYTVTWTSLSQSSSHVWHCVFNCRYWFCTKLLKPGPLPSSAALLTLGAESSVWVSHCALNLPFGLATCTAVSVKNKGITSRTKAMSCCSESWTRFVFPPCSSYFCIRNPREEVGLVHW